MRVFLADPSYLTQANSHNLYVPLNIGLVGAYVMEKYPIDLGMFKDPQKLCSLVRDYKPELVGLSLYYWTHALTKQITKIIKEVSPETKIVLGGPCIDTDPNEQASIFKRFEHVDAIVPNEGELGFAGIVESILAGEFKTKPIPGVTWRDGIELSRGAQIGLSTDLTTVPSPYLTGIMDEWLADPYRPIVQTSRLCPYTCAFCVSGKDRGKLRAFPLERVKEELTYIGRKYTGNRDQLTYIADENFGILERDLVVADYILEAQKEFGYPNKIFYYNDKRFTQTSRLLHEKLGHMCWHGVCLSLQSENPDALKAINRRNLTDEQVTSALAWAKNLKLKTSTELIFGLPGETLDSFCATIDKCAKFGFDVINTYALIIFDGIEMNRPKYREAHKLKTKFRPIGSSHGTVLNTYIREYEEIAVASETLSYDDYRILCGLQVLLQLIYVYGLCKDSFMELVQGGHSLTGFLRKALTPLDGNDFLATWHQSFLKELFDHFDNELSDEPKQTKISSIGTINQDLIVAVFNRIAATYS